MPSTTVEEWPSPLITSCDSFDSFSIVKLPTTVYDFEKYLIDLCQKNWIIIFFDGLITKLHLNDIRKSEIIQFEHKSGLFFVFLLFDLLASVSIHCSIGT